MPHTPGPWKVGFCQAEDDSIITEVLDSNGREIASVDFRGKETLANANLIAAAPMLLKMCKAMLTDLESKAVHGPADSFHRKLYAVIAAAEGGEDNG